MDEPVESERALLMADLCGYTALTETHGALKASETVLRFVRLAKACLEPGVTIVDSIGDAVFCAGGDTLAVARTALRLRDLVDREPEFLRVSIGLHQGLVVEREGRLFGAPINLAARLAAHAGGGQVLCTEPVATAVAAGREAHPEALGEHHFKNVARPVQLYELAPAAGSRPVTAIDPVCRMQVEVDHAAASVPNGGVTYHFCSAGCAEMFSQAPELYGGKAP